MSNPKMKFKSTLLLAGKTATGIRVPEEVVEQLGAGKKPPVKVTINGYTYQNTIAVMGGVFMLSVSSDVRQNTGINSGDMVEVLLELDSGPREVSIPSDFKKALDENGAAKIFFSTLSNSNKKRYTIPIEQAKTEETKNRRIEKAIADLKLQKKI